MKSQGSAIAAREWAGFCTSGMLLGPLELAQSAPNVAPNNTSRLGLNEYYEQEAARLRPTGRPISDLPAINRGPALREWDRRLGRFRNR